jgi:hypothetical protein
MCDFLSVQQRKRGWGAVKRGDSEEEGGKYREIKREEREGWDDTILRHVKFFIKSYFFGCFFF